MLAEQLNTEYQLLAMILIDKAYELMLYIGHNSGYVFQQKVIYERKYRKRKDHLLYRSI